MQESKTKEKILKKVRKALIQRTDNPYPVLDLDSNVYAYADDQLELSFAQQLTKAGGLFVFCENELDFAENLIGLAVQRGWKSFFCKEHKIKHHLDNIEFPYVDNDEEMMTTDVAITLCEALAARTGSVIVSSKQLSGRRLPIITPVHVVLSYTSQLTDDIKSALNMVRSKYGEVLPSMIATITGPSRTADIEGSIVYGAHGPKELIVFLIDDLTINDIEEV